VRDNAKLRFTDRIRAFDTYIDALAFDTTSLSQIGTATVYDQFAFQYKYWTALERVRPYWNLNQGAGWTGNGAQFYLTNTSISDSGAYVTNANTFNAQNSQAYNQVVNGGGFDMGYASPSGNPSDSRYDDMRVNVNYTDNSGKKGASSFNTYDVWGRKEIDKLVQENYNDYTYAWSSKWKPIYDQRIQQSFKMVSIDTPLFEKLPVEQTTTKQVPKVVMESVTVWETRPLTVTETVLKTVVDTSNVTANAFGEANTSLGANNVVVRAGGTASLSGKIQATSSLSLQADDTLRVRSLATTLVGGVSVPITSALKGETIVLSAGQLLDVHDTAQVTAVQNAATVATTASVLFESGRDIRLGGVSSADSSTTLTVSAGRDAQISGSLTAGAVVLSSGQGDAQSGSITADADTRITATLAGITASAGALGGDIRLTDATLTVPTGNATLSNQLITLSSAQGSVLQTLITRISGGTQKSLPSGLLVADRVVASAASGITLNTRTADVDLQLSDIGGIVLHNEGNLKISRAESYDGAISITNAGDVDARYLVAKGLSDRNDILVSTEARAPSLTANLTVGQFSTGSGSGTLVRRGDISFLVQGALTFLDPTKPIQADELQLSVAGGLGTQAAPLFTAVNALRLATTQAGHVYVSQGTQTLKLNEVAIANGSFTLNAGGNVDLVDVRSRANTDAADITVTAAGDVMVRYVSAGIYAQDASDPVLFKADGITPVGYTIIQSKGDVSLTSTGGRVYEVFVDDAVDVVADVLTVRASTGITGLELALNTLDAQTSTGDITLSEQDSFLEKYPVLDGQGNPVLNAQNQPTYKYPGLSVLRAHIITPTLNLDDVSLSAQRDLRIDPLGVVKG
ncbi:MAG: hypothetical protein WCK08_20175, partial [Betaproteobacteria bacterium]